MKQIFILICVLAGASHMQAQDSLAVDTAELAKKSTFTIGTVYGNNTSYYGQKPEEATPYLALAGNLRFPSGIYFTGTAYRLLKDTSGVVSAGSVGAGVELKLGKPVTLDLNYSHTFYPAGSPFLQAANDNTFSATITYDYWLSSSLTYDYAFGEQEDMFGTFVTSKSISLGSLFSPKDGISIAPAIEVSAGTQRYYQTYVTEKRVRDSIAGIPLLPILGGGSTVNETSTSETASFDLLSYSARLPISFYRASYLLEASYQLSFLTDKVQGSGGQKNSFFTLSFYYQF